MHQILDYYSIWPAFALTALILLVLATPMFRVLSMPPAAHPRARRIKSIDGLRGYLALAVVFHHAAILHLFLQRGTFQSESWSAPPARFYASIGPAGVSMFFMITGYLFWSRLLKQPGKPEWRNLYIGRVFRIGPLYLIAVSIALILDRLKTFNYMAVVSHSSTSLLKQLSSVCLLGLSVYPDANRLLAGVTWSIQYEWFFYASLPLLALLFSSTRLKLSLFTGILVSCLLIRLRCYHVLSGTRTLPILAALFLIGMICASLQERGGKKRIPDWLSSVMTLALLACVFAFPDVYTPGPVLLLGGAFYLIASGCTVFGALTIRAAIRLGDVSYGIYLLQGLVLSVGFRSLALRKFALASPLQHWALTLASLVALVSVATLAHCGVERPCIEGGRKIVKMLADRHYGATYQ